MHRKLISPSSSGSKGETNRLETEFTQPNLDSGDTPRRGNTSERVNTTTKTSNEGIKIMGEKEDVTVAGGNVGGKERDSIQPPGNIHGTLDGGVNDGGFNGGATDGDGYTLVGKGGKNARSDKAIGIKVIRDGKRDGTAWSNKDLSNLFQLISMVDPNVLFMNCKSQDKSAWKVGDTSTMLRTDWQSKLDIQTEPWGRQSEHRERTHLSFYIVSDKISPNLRELREDPNIQDFLKLGKCIMSQTRLLESRSKVVQYIVGKDPNHTHRDALAVRYEEHFGSCIKSGKRIPVTIANLPTTTGGRILGVVVGARDETLATKLLKENPIDHLETLSPSLRRSNQASFQARMKEHECVVSQTKAFKVSGMVYEEIFTFRDMMFATAAADYLVDVADTNHSKDSGVVYIQYIQDHRLKVLACLEEVLESFQPARLVDPDASVAMTANTKEKVTTDVPPSKFSSIIDMSVVVKKPAPAATASKPKSITQPKPRTFSQALMNQINDTESADSESDTSNDSTLDTAKTQRELELEEKCAELEHSNVLLQTQLKSSQDECQELKDQLQQVTLKQQQQDAFIAAQEETNATQAAMNAKFEMAMAAWSISTATSKKHSPKRTPTEKSAKRGRFPAPPGTNTAQPPLLQRTSLLNQFDSAAKSPVEPLTQEMADATLADPSAEAGKYV